MSRSPGGLLALHLPQPLARSAQTPVLCVKDRVRPVLPVQIAWESQSPQHILWFLARRGWDTGHHSVPLGERLSQCFLGATGGLSRGSGSPSTSCIPFPLPALGTNLTPVSMHLPIHINETFNINGTIHYVAFPTWIYLVYCFQASSML